MEEHIIRRTEKTEALKAALNECRFIYMTSFFGSGKTVLLDQLGETTDKQVLLFDAAKDDWQTFEGKASDVSDTLLLIDSLHLIDDDTAERIASFLHKLPKDCSAVLCGRAQVPEAFQIMMVRGEMNTLGVDFVVFTKAEIAELFATYEISLRSEDISYLKNTAWGWAVMLHGVAKKLDGSPAVPISSMRLGLSEEFGNVFVKQVLSKLPDDEIRLLFRLSVLERFDSATARAVTQLDNASELMENISAKSYILMREKQGVYSFIPFVKKALFRELEQHSGTVKINELYTRAGEYFRQQEMIPQAAQMFLKAHDNEKVAALLTESAAKRPSSSDLSELLEAYDALPREMILGHPELMKGKCIAESLRGQPAASNMWYDELKAFIDRTPRGSPERKTAEEAAAYLDIGLAQRGTGSILKTLLTTAKRGIFTKSQSWTTGFNIAGNSVSLMNGGKDFCRWVPKGYEIYKRFRVPVEMAVGRGGSGLADLAIAECELESRLDGDYNNAMDIAVKGFTQVSDDIEMRCVGIGIQSRILAAKGKLPDAIKMIENAIERLPANAPWRLRENLDVYRMTLQLMQGETADAFDWLENRSPDEIKDFVILDRYRYILKLRLYIILGRWDKTEYLTAVMRNYAESYDRPYIRIQLHILEAEIYRRTGSTKWREEIQSAIDLARKYKLIRVIADEGAPADAMIRGLKPHKEEWLDAVILLAQRQAAHCPAYMVTREEKPMFNEREKQVWAYLVQGLKNKEIAEKLGFTERNTKYHTIEIFKKLGVNSRAEAIKKAAEIGEI